MLGRLPAKKGGLAHVGAEAASSVGKVQGVVRVVELSTGGHWDANRLAVRHVEGGEDIADILGFVHVDGPSGRAAVGDACELGALPIHNCLEHLK